MRRQNLLWGMLGFTLGLTNSLTYICCRGAEPDYFEQRQAMVSEQIVSRGINDEKVIVAMRAVQRHLFVPDAVRQFSYNDSPLSIGYGQTISQPYIVALMTELAQLTGEEKVLEIGTGSGYQAAVLAELGLEVYTIEILQPLADSASQRLKELGYTTVTVQCGDGYQGWPEHAPFDVIIVTAAPPEIPEALIAQLKEGGRMVIPVGDYFQELKLVKKVRGQIKVDTIIPVRFVPMVPAKH